MRRFRSDPALPDDPAAAGAGSYASPRFSLDGQRLAYVAGVADGEGASRIHVRLLDGGEDAPLKCQHKGE